MEEIIPVHEVHKMDRKSEAIAFKIWCDKYESSISNLHEEFFTVEQLYDKFKEENP